MTTKKELLKQFDEMHIAYIFKTPFDFKNEAIKLRQLIMDIP